MLGSLIESGLWPRLMGHLSAKPGGRIETIQQWASELPVPIAISRSVAQQFIQLGIDARIASKSWMAEVPWHQIHVPSVHIASSTLPPPHQLTELHYGLIIEPPSNAPPRSRDRTIPITFSSQRPITFSEWLAELGNVLSVIGDSTPGLRHTIAEVEENWRAGGRTKILPNYLVEHILSYKDE